LLCAYGLKPKKLQFQCPPTLEEREFLTSNDGTAASLAAGYLVGLNLEASIPDTFRSPPVPLPYDIVFGGSASTDSESGRETVSVSSFETSITRDDIEESDCKVQTKSAPISPRKVELSKSNGTQVLVTEEEDVCPICLEGTVARVIKSRITSVRFLFLCFSLLHKEE
jgi:hypothetical protein